MKKTSTRNPVTGIAAEIQLVSPVDALIEERKNQLLAESIQQGAYVVTGYWRWFGERIAWAEKMVGMSKHSETTAQGFEDEVAGWLRARDLFFTLAPNALENVMRTVADQIEQELAGTPQGSDISGNLRFTTAHDAYLANSDSDVLSH